MLRKSVYRLAENTAEPVLVLDRPSSIGFRPDGEMVVVDSAKSLVHRLQQGTIVESLDLSGLSLHLNDMVVDRHGWAYIDGFGRGGAVSNWTADGSIVLVTFDSPPRKVADNLVAPNGIGISPDACTLVVGEAVAGARSGGAQLVGYSIAADGSLSHKRIIGTIARGLGDGLCLDSEGGIWVGTAWGHEAQRFLGGEIVERISFDDGKWVLACALGGPELRTLFLCTTDPPPGGDPSRFARGWVEIAEVGVPGFVHE